MERWQDKVISIVGLLFGFMLIPLIIDSYYGHTVNIITSFLTMSGLFILAYCFFTLRLKLSFIAELFAGSMWLILLIQGVLSI